MRSMIRSESEPQSPDTEPFVDTKKSCEQSGVSYKAKGRDESSSKKKIVQLNDIREEEIAIDNMSDSILNEIKIIDVSDFEVGILSHNKEAIIGEPVYIKEEDEQDIECKAENEFLYSEQEQSLLHHNLGSDDSSDKTLCTSESEKQQLACQHPDITANNKTAKIRPTTSAERELLWQLISEEEELHNTGNSAQILMAKKQAFARVTRKFNAAGLGQERTYKQLYSAWGRMKKKKRREEAKKNSEERECSLSKNVGDGRVSEHVMIGPSTRKEAHETQEAEPRVACSLAAPSVSEEVGLLLNVGSINTDNECLCCGPSSHLAGVPSPQSSNTSTISSVLAYEHVPVDSEDCKYHRHMVDPTSSHNKASSISTTNHLASNGSLSHRSAPYPSSSHSKENKRSSIDEPWFSTHDFLESFATEKAEAQREIWAKQKQLLELQLQKTEMKIELYK